MKDLRIGLVGGGGMGRVHYCNWKVIPGAEVVALCDTGPNARKTAEEWGIPCYGSVTEMTRHTPIDVVDICVPTFLHKAVALEALNLKKDTICEKPIALCYADAKAMYDAARDNGCNLYIAQVLQFTKEVEVLRELVRSGEYGPVLDACFERLSACPRWAVGGWLFDKEKSGLIPYDLHIHDLDVMVSLFGKPKGYTKTACRGRGKAYDEQIRVVYDYGDFHVNTEAAWFNADSPWTARWRVYFENAVVINDGTTVTAYQFDKPPKVFDTKDAVEISTGINVPPCGWYYNELGHFAACIQEGVPSPRVTETQMLTVMELLEEIGK